MNLISIPVYRSTLLISFVFYCYGSYCSYISLHLVRYGWYRLCSRTSKLYLTILLIEATITTTRFLPEKRTVYAWFGGNGPLTNTLTNIRKSAGGHSGQDSYLYPQKAGPKVLESTQQQSFDAPTHLHTQEVTGSSPVVSTITIKNWNLSPAGGIEIRSCLEDITV